MREPGTHHARHNDESDSAAPPVLAGVVWITATRLRWKDRVQSSHMPTLKLTNEIIAAAIDGYEAQKIHIDGKIAALRAMLPGGSPEAAAPEAPTRKRKISAAARRRMATAQKKRWAAIKGVADAEPSAPKETPKPKRRISKEGMARIVAATKKRWAAVRAAKAQQQKDAATKTAKKKAVKKPAASPAVAQAAG